MTKQQQSPNTSTKPDQSWPGRHKALLIVAALTISVGALITYGVAYYFGNRAQEVARPLEKALVDAGAVKQCESGDSGRGWDNQAPWYGATYMSDLSKEEATQLINRIAGANGYKLTYQQSPYSYIDWYSDTTSKKNELPGFEEGNVKLQFSVYSGGDNLGCPGKELQYDEQRAAIKVNVSLPSYRQ